MTNNLDGETKIPNWFLGLLAVIAIPLVGFVFWLSINVSTQGNRLDRLEVGREKLVTRVEEQTLAIVELRLEIQRLLVVKPSDVIRKLEELDRKIEEFSKKEINMEGHIPHKDN